MKMVLREDLLWIADCSCHCNEGLLEDSREAATCCGLCVEWNGLCVGDLTSNRVSVAVTRLAPRDTIERATQVCIL